MDDTLPMRLRAVNLGYRGYSVEGPRDVQELHAVSGVRQAQLAHDLSEEAGQLSGTPHTGGRDEAGGGADSLAASQLIQWERK